MIQAVRYAVNVSTVFAGHPAQDRMAAAGRAGYRDVESWWPFAGHRPDAREVTRFLHSIESADLHLIALNLYSGEREHGERGIATQRARESEFKHSIDVIVHIAQRTGCRMFNALYGRVTPHSEAAEREHALTQLTIAADAVGSLGGTILLEPLSGIPDYGIHTTQGAFEVCRQVRERSAAASIGVLADLFHLAVNGEDVGAVVRDRAAELTHVQIADLPGRGRPGTGRLPLQDWIVDLYGHGYRGWIALEYFGSG